MRRVLIALAALLLILGLAPMAAGASGGDDDSGSGGVSSGSDDDDDADDDRDDDDSDDDRDDADRDDADRDDSDDDDDDDDRDDDDRDDDDRGDEDEVDEDEDDDGDGGRQRRRRHRRGRDDDGAADGSGGPGGTGGTGGSANPGGGGQNGPAPTTGRVRVLDDSFAPATINVAAGGTVTWDNVSREHTVTADDGSFDSGVFDAGQNFSQTFASPGTFSYKCLIHSDMTGTVVVGGGQGSGSTPAASSQGSPGSTGSTGSTGATGAASPSVKGSSSAPRLGMPVGSAGESSLPSLGDVPAPLTAAAASEADVEVRDFEFAPADVTVAPGATVRWTLTGTAPHTVTADGFDSGSLAPGDSYEQTFTEPGVVEYVCKFHPEMQATVTVAGNAAPPPDPGGAGAGGAAPDATTSAPGGSGSGGSGSSSAGGSSGSAVLANSGSRALPLLVWALSVMLLGASVLLISRRRGPRPRQPV